MNTFRKSNSEAFTSQPIELYDNRLDTLARIETDGTRVVIRTTRDNITAGAKAAFVHYLANEGFIPEHYRWYSCHSAAAEPRIQWLTDSSWVSLGRQGMRFGAKLWSFLTWGRLLALGLFVIAFALALWLKPR